MYDIAKLSNGSLTQAAHQDNKWLLKIFKYVTFTVNHNHKISQQGIYGQLSMSIQLLALQDYKPWLVLFQFNMSIHSQPWLNHDSRTEADCSVHSFFLNLHLVLRTLWPPLKWHRQTQIITPYKTHLIKMQFNFKYWPDWLVKIRSYRDPMLLTQSIQMAAQGISILKNSKNHSHLKMSNNTKKFWYLYGLKQLTQNKSHQWLNTKRHLLFDFNWQLCSRTKNNQEGKWTSSFTSFGESKFCITSDSHKWQRQMMNILFVEPMEKGSGTYLLAVCFRDLQKTSNQRIT